MEERILAAIDVGTNAVRLELARPLPGGSLEILHQERDPVRPGEGVFTTGSIPRDVADRLLATLRRYAALCRRHRAKLRAVATSAVREAKNGAEIVRRARREAGIELEVVSGREEARLICLGVLHGRPPKSRSLVIDIGGGSTEIATARGDEPTNLWSVAIGAVRLTEIFSVRGRIRPKQLALVRSFAAEAFRETLPARLPHGSAAFGSSGTIQAVASFAAGGSRLRLRDLERAVEKLADMRLDERRRRFEPRRAEIIVAGAVVLEAVMRHLSLDSLTAVDTGLRNGLLVDMVRRSASAFTDTGEASVAIGRRFHFDEPHARQVSRLSLALFDQLASLHGLPASARRLLESAALLHDVGNAVSYARHHKHTYYLVANADIPGFADREREQVALIARYHRRSPPNRNRSDLESLSSSELATVRKLATLLRLGDSLDRSHQQSVERIQALTGDSAVRIQIRARAPVDLEIWDAHREAALFRQVFRHRLTVTASVRRAHARNAR